MAANLLLPAAVILILPHNPWAESSASSFIQQCLRVKEVHFDDDDLRPPSVAAFRSGTAVAKKCVEFECFLRDESRDLRHLGKLPCFTDRDCLDDVSGMRCNAGFCDCPRWSAFNPLQCKCQAAERCGDSPANFCHNGMKCSDRLCGCDSFLDKLIEPHSQLCVQMKTTDAVNRHLPEETRHSGFTVALIVAAALLTVTVVVLGLGMGSGSLRSLCDRGQYVCDEDVPQKAEKINSGGVPHVAAWDLPGLDYLSEEQTMKYLRRGKSSPSSEGGDDRPLRRAEACAGINISPSPSSSGGGSGGGSLPESDRFEVRQINGNLPQRPSLQSQISSTTVHSNML